MEEIDQREISTAIDDFWRARNQADLQELISRFTGEQTQLLSFDEVKKMLRLQASADIGLRDIPLEAIVGSVGRYTDFTCDFLPRRKIHPERWARIKTAASGLVGLPPIEAYKIESGRLFCQRWKSSCIRRQINLRHVHPGLRYRGQNGHTHNTRYPSG